MSSFDALLLQWRPYAAEERWPQARPFLQDAGHLFRRFHSGGESVASGHVYQMFARRQPTAFRLDARHEPRK